MRPRPLSACAKYWAPSRWCLGAVLGLVLLSGVRAASPRDELLRFVPQETAICVIFQDLREHWQSLYQSPFADQFRRSIAAVLDSTKEMESLKRLEKTLEKQLGLNWEQVRDDIFGDSIIFAFRPGRPDNPQEDRGLFLLRARNGKTLAELIDRINEAQRKTGQLEARQYKGSVYYCRMEMRDTSYYHLRGPILVLSKQEEILKEALDADRALAANAEPPLIGVLKRLEVDRALLALWLNPRAFDAAIEAQARKAKPNGEPEIPKTVAACWKALDGLALALNLDRDLSISLAVRAQLDKLPPATRNLILQASQQPSLGRIFPEDPLIAIAGRLDLAALFASLNEFLSPKSREALQSNLNRTVSAALGKDIAKDVLPKLGPDIGLIVMAPPAQDKSWVPNTLFAMRVDAGTKAAPVDQSLLAGVRFLAMLAVLGHNGNNPNQPISLKDTAIDRRDIAYIAGDAFPAGLQPAFALHAGYLLIASAPEVIGRFSAPPPGGQTPAEPISLLRISFKAWRSYLRDREEQLVQAMTAHKQMTPDEARAKLRQVQAALVSFDRLELRQKAEKELLTLTLRLQPSLPFSK